MPLRALSAIVLSLAVILCGPSATALADEASTGDDLVNPVLLRATQNGEVINFISPSSTPYGYLFGVDNENNDYDIIIDTVGLELAITPESCVDNFEVVSPQTKPLGGVRVPAGGVGNEEGTPTPPWVIDPAFTFQAEGRECQNIRIGTELTIDYVNVPAVDDVDSTIATLVEGARVTEAELDQPVTLRADFKLGDDLPEGRDFVSPTGSVQFFVDGEPYGDPVSLNPDGSATPRRC